MNLLILIAALAGFILVYSLLMAVKPHKETLEDKVKRLAAEKEAATAPKKTLTWKDYLTRLSKFTPRKWAKKIENDLRNSGVPLTGGEFIVLQLFLLVLFSLLALALTSISYVVVLLPLLSILLPHIYIIRSRNKKILLFNNQLADVLLTLANSLKAGFSLFQAMDMASQEMPDPIASEIKITLKEMTYGESTETSLVNFTHRVPSRDLDLMVTAIIIQRQIGGNLAEILLSIHGTIQERLRLQGEVKSLTAQGRLSGILIGGLPFAMGMIISVMQPGYLTVLFTQPIGIGLLVAGLISQVIGFIAINRIVNIKL